MRNVWDIIFNGSHQKFYKAFLVVTVCEYVPHVWQVEFPTSFGDLIGHDTVKHSLQSAVLKEGEVPLHIRFAWLHEIVSLDVLVLRGYRLGPELSLA